MTTSRRRRRRRDRARRVTNVLARDPLGRVPVVRARTDAPVAVADVIGVVTRSDVLRALHAGGEAARRRRRRSLAAQLGAPRPRRPAAPRCRRWRPPIAAPIWSAARCATCCSASAASDIDIAVEGDGIEFARELARAARRPRARPPEVPDGRDRGRAPGDGRARALRVDVASTRTEFYDYPAALPKVEHATIRGDLARRDFSINAMAVSLNPRDFGALLDFFGGLDDLRRKRIRVLHNLSFIEDPTRIFRAVRYEDRYGFRMDRHTLALARACSEMDLIGDLSSARLRDELVALLDEPRISLHAAPPQGARPAARAASAPRARREQRGAGRRGRRPAAPLRPDARGAGLAGAPRRHAARARARGDRGVGRAHEVPPRATRACWCAPGSSARGSSGDLRRPLSEADLYEIARGEPLEALLVAMALSAGAASASSAWRSSSVAPAACDSRSAGATSWRWAIASRPTSARCSTSCCASS